MIRVLMSLVLTGKSVKINHTTRSHQVIQSGKNTERSLLCFPRMNEVLKIAKVAFVRFSVLQTQHLFWYQLCPLYCSYLATLQGTATFTLGLHDYCQNDYHDYFDQY